MNADKIHRLLKIAVEREASDLHINTGLPPVLRIDGDLRHIPGEDVVNAGESENIILPMLTEEQRQKFEADWELSFSYKFESVGRFRVNVARAKGELQMAVRVVPLTVKSIEELGLPAIVKDLARKMSGLVLVTGPTGVGKTTTLAAMIDLINMEKKCRIVTIEDPIEYVHSHKGSIVMQREVHSDTKSFANALIHSLRQDPNVICVGEMRDLETISTTLIAAETGHLVLATLHTPDAVQTVGRIVDVFPPYQQEQVRTQLAFSLQGVVAQQLLPRFDGPGRVVAAEVLVSTGAIRNLIRENKIEQIQNFIQTGSEAGMVTMDDSIRDLYEQGMISYDVAIARVKNPADFRKFG